jgi:hypothetical protein
MRKVKNVFLDHENYIAYRAMLRNEMPDLSWQDSASCVYIPSWGERVHDASLCQDNRGAGELAFEVMKSVYPNIKLRWTGEEMKMLDRQSPRFFNTQYINGWLGYIDIKSAYWQFYKRLYLDGRRPLKGLRLPLLPIAQQLEFNKGARNAVVGIARSTHMKWCKGVEVKKVKKYNRYLSPLLWYHVQGILQYIASIMVLQFGAVYICTDSYVFNTSMGYMGALVWFSEMGIDIHFTEAERANIWGWGSYSIGQQETKEIEKLTSVAINSLDLQEDDYRIFEFWRKNNE